MSFATINVPSSYGWVLLAAGVGPFVTSSIMGSKVMGARAKYNIWYPNLYAVPGQHDHADEFNRIQRGHQNFLENEPTFAVMTLIGGLKHPIACAIGAVLFCVGSILYQTGYADSSKDVKVARHAKGGPIKYIGLLTSLISACKFAYDVITA